MKNTVGIMGLAAAFTLGLGAVGERAEATELKEITADEYYGAAYYKRALEHPQIQKLSSEKKKLRAIAKDIGWRSKKLKAAIEKVEGLLGDPTKLGKTAIEKMLAKSRIKGRVKSVLINDSEPKHVVAYICWKAGKTKDVIKEASTIGHAVGESAPFVSTLSLNAIHKSATDCSNTKKSIWSGKIGHDGMVRINPDRIDSYADRMYGRLFEGVKKKF